MAQRQPLVLISGNIKELPLTDTLPVNSVTTSQNTASLPSTTTTVVSGVLGAAGFYRIEFLLSALVNSTTSGTIGVTPTVLGVATNTLNFTIPATAGTRVVVQGAADVYWDGTSSGWAALFKVYGTIAGGSTTGSTTNAGNLIGASSGLSSAISVALSTGNASITGTLNARLTITPLAA